MTQHPTAAPGRFEPFEELDLATLRTRTSVKWRMHAPDVLPLWVAEMDALPAAAVVDAVTDAMRRGDTGYPAPAGGIEYAEALADVAARRWGWRLDVAHTSLVADVLTGVNVVLDLVTEPGDTVLVPAPVYAPLLDFTAGSGRRVVPVGLTPDFRLDLDAIGAVLADGGVRALLLCSPHNPTGTVHTAEELRAVAALAAEHGVAVVVDEIHALLAPEGFTPYLSVADEGFVVTSASKAFNLAGLKAGVIVAGARSRHLLERIPLAVTYGVAHLGVIAHIAAWNHGDPWIDAVNANISSNSDVLGDLLAARIPEIGYLRPDATYLCWLDCTRLGLGDDPAVAFLERGRVALNSGPAFGPGGAGHVRLNLAASRATLTDAVDRMAASL